MFSAITALESSVKNGLFMPISLPCLAARRIIRPAGRAARSLIRVCIRALVIRVRRLRVGIVVRTVRILPLRRLIICPRVRVKLAVYGLRHTVHFVYNAVHRTLHLAGNLLPVEVIHALRHLVAHLVDNAVRRGVFKLVLERVRVIRAVRRIRVSVLFVRILCVRFWHRLSNGNAS